MALNPTFGEYITKEYGLLKQILSYLNPCDLWNAKMVCQDWKKAVESLTEKNPVMIVCDVDENTAPYFNSHKPIVPAFVLHQCPINVLAKRSSISCKKCGVSFVPGLCPCSFVKTDVPYILLSSFDYLEDDDDMSKDDFGKMFMWFLLPASDHIQLSVFIRELNDEIFSQPVTEEIVDQCVGGRQPIKCLLVLVRLNSIVRRLQATPLWLRDLFRKVFNRHGKTFGFGCGILNFIESRGHSSDFWFSQDLVILTLRGENITAHSDILKTAFEPEMEEFMETLAERAGPLPEGGTRMAFVFQSIVRKDLQIMERRAFTKAFPSVPLFGMLNHEACGTDNRCCTVSCDAWTRLGIEKKISSNLEFHYSGSRSSTYVVLTFEKV